MKHGACRHYSSCILPGPSMVFWERGGLSLWWPCECTVHISTHRQCTWPKAPTSVWKVCLGDGWGCVSQGSVTENIRDAKTGHCWETWDFSNGDIGLRTPWWPCWAFSGTVLWSKIFPFNLPSFSPSLGVRPASQVSQPPWLPPHFLLQMFPLIYFSQV